jgi:peptidyl-prolyl cis-trans isomerase C
VKRQVLEPLFHALVLSPLAFAGYWLVADHGVALERIEIDRMQLATLRDEFRETWSRSPTEAELQGLAEFAAREEILYRAGEALGIPRDDPALWLRVQHEITAQADAGYAARAPTDAELADWLDMHASRYARPATVTYSQILLVAAGTLGDAATAAQRTRNRLERGERPARLGLATRLPARQSKVRLDDVELNYGPAFADALARLPVGVWLGPVESRHGAHLVRVDSRMSGGRPALDEVRDDVTRDYEIARHQRALEASIEALRQRYEIYVSPKYARQASR